MTHRMILWEVDWFLGCNDWVYVDQYNLYEVLWTISPTCKVFRHILIKGVLFFSYLERKINKVIEEPTQDMTLVSS